MKTYLFKSFYLHKTKKSVIFDRLIRKKVQLKEILKHFARVISFSINLLFLKSDHLKIPENKLDFCCHIFYHILGHGV